MGNEALLRINAVKEKTGLKQAMLYALIAQGEFPKPIKLTKRCSAWLLSEVEAFIQSRIAASRAGASGGAN
jgi:prophage regulatory protein